MRFLSRLNWALSVPAVMVIMSGAVVGSGTVLIDARIADYFEHTDAFGNAVVEMYAQGLQQGQAMRNILLDPANPKAYENMDKADKAFDAALAGARQTASAASDREWLDTVGNQRATLAEVRQQLKAMAKADPAGAVAFLNAHETPAWRELRKGLLERKAEATAAKRSWQENSAKDMAFARNGIIVLSLICSAICIMFPVMLRRDVLRELGGHPEDARALLATIGSGKLEVSVPVRPADTFSVLAQIESMRRSLREMIGSLRDSSAAIADGAGQMASGTRDLSQRTENQASSLEEVVASIGELRLNVRQTAEAARVADGLAGQASQAADEGGRAVHEMVEVMERITTSSNRIAEIIAVIDSIAFQTNILALNAAVEAARAAEHGRGFAVVASEVRGLAQRSSQAANEIRELIGTSVGDVARGGEAAQGAGVTITGAVDQVKRMAQLIAEISASANQQSLGLDQIGSALGELDQMTQENAAMVEENTQATRALASNAQQLTASVRRFGVAA
ncbi:MAG: methyl-accepting chemotaxis protein [Burkholderiaceae bacterium]